MYIYIYIYVCNSFIGTRRWLRARFRAWFRKSPRLRGAAGSCGWGS